MRSGRLPHACTSARCEVLQIGGGGEQRYVEGDVRLERTGIAELRDPNLFSYISAGAASPQAPPIIVIAPSIDSVLHLPSLQPYYRVYSWLSPLRAEALHTWDIGRTLALESRGQNRLYDTDEAFRLSSPDDELINADHRGKIAARRLALVGGETSALLL